MVGLAVFHRRFGIDRRASIPHGRPRGDMPVYSPWCSRLVLWVAGLVAAPLRSSSSDGLRPRSPLRPCTRRARSSATNGQNAHFTWPAHNFRSVRDAWACTSAVSSGRSRGCCWLASAPVQSDRRATTAEAAPVAKDSLLVGAAHRGDRNHSLAWMVGSREPAASAVRGTAGPRNRRRSFAPAASRDLR